MEEQRLNDLAWRRWGAYVSNRQWGTVREDYSADGNAWNYISHDEARSRAYRWGEDGIAGWCDRYQFLVFSFAFWNGKDPILKERFFGLTPFEGNHGEDVKEYYFYLDATPTHSYMKFLYKYPIEKFPYEQLVDENKKRTTKDLEYELADTGVFAKGYFDISIEYAKNAPDDTFIRLEVTNQSSQEASIDILPQLYFRNYWSWDSLSAPTIKAIDGALYADPTNVPSPDWLIKEYHLPPLYLYSESPADILFTENETGAKDAFHRAVIQKEKNNKSQGSKACFHFPSVKIPPGKSRTFCFRLTTTKTKNPLKDAGAIFSQRIQEADAFYTKIQPQKLSADEKQIHRQAIAGMLWSTQFYLYDVEKWLKGDKVPPPAAHARIRNVHWQHLHASDLISMPDKWEYPWFASWDMAFQTIVLSLVDLPFAKAQLGLFLKSRYQHPSGQIPAYEWNFSDTNPPVQAWALWHLYELDKDVNFLEANFVKLMENFSWWVNRVDRLGNNIFEGGFLGLDNISVIDRSKPLPGGGFFEQSDATGWMGFFAVLMMRIALELSKTRPIYEKLSFVYFEHFIAIAAAMEKTKGRAIDLWDTTDGFFYDAIAYPDGNHESLKIRSYVGLIPFFTLQFFSEEDLQKYHSHFYEKMQLYLKHSPQLLGRCISPVTLQKKGYVFSLMTIHQMEKLLQKAFDPTEFFSSFGLRSLSKYHEKHPFTFASTTVGYEPGESLERIKGGNSNWRGPVWMPINYLFYKSLRHLEKEGGVSFGKQRQSLAQNLLSIFRKDKSGKRPVHQGNAGADLLNEHPLFYEHYHGDTGRGLGASHQTGWSGLIANIIQDL
ncbi:MAG: glucosidase [Verrucomicrobia bacterium]|nr:glucosidase [Verrucomicrobiota bacterium]